MAKRVRPLSSVQIRNLKPTNKIVELVDGAVAGLRVRMTPNGVMTWSLNIRDAKGRRRRFDVGRGLGLAAARERAEALRHQIRDGRDPSVEKIAARERAKAAKAGIGTFGSIVADYYRSGPGSLLRTRVEQERRIKNVFAEHVQRPATEISPAELQITADRHPSASAAGHAVAYVRPVAAWAAKRELMRTGFRELEKPASSNDDQGDRNGQRVLTIDELKQILPVLGRTGHAAAARFMLYTGCRLEEACGATWGEIDLERGIWTIPASRRKDTWSKRRTNRMAQTDHVVILPRQARDILRQIGSGSASVLVFVGQRSAKLQNWDRWNKSVATMSGIRGWDRHTLRRTTATLVGQLGAPPHLVSALLGHRNIGGQLTAGYSKARYTDEVGDFLQRAADWLDAMVPGGPKAAHTESRTEGFTAR
jgi:integrase